MLAGKLIQFPLYLPQQGADYKEFKVPLVHVKLQAVTYRLDVNLKYSDKIERLLTHMPVYFTSFLYINVDRSG